MRASLKSQHGEDAASFLSLKLSDLAKVKAAAEDFLGRGQSLELLANNAGLAGQRGQTAQGFELTFGVNHLGHFLFTQLLLDKAKESAPSRIVNVASKARYIPKAWDWDTLRGTTHTKTGYPESGLSKLAKVPFTTALARRLEGSGVTTYSLQPGVVASDIWRKVPFPFRGLIKLFMVSEDEGARTTLYCTTDPSLAEASGRVRAHASVATSENAVDPVGGHLPAHESRQIHARHGLRLCEGADDPRRPALDAQHLVVGDGAPGAARDAHAGPGWRRLDRARWGGSAPGGDGVAAETDAAAPIDEGSAPVAGVGLPTERETSNHCASAVPGSSASQGSASSPSAAAVSTSICSWYAASLAASAVAIGSREEPLRGDSYA